MIQLETAYVQRAFVADDRQADDDQQIDPAFPGMADLVRTGPLTRITSAELVNRLVP